MRRHLKPSTLLTLALLVFSIPDAQAQPVSLIEQLLASKASLVDVYALEEGAVIDPTKDSIPAEKRGAGFVIDPSGFIITNLHTISFTQKIAIELHDHTILSAKILKIIPTYDLVLLKVDQPEKLTPIEVADSNNVRLGDEVINIGNSRLLKETLSAGLVIGVGKDAKTEEVSLIKVRMSLYKGDSGGPLFNQDGKLIGMVMGKLRKVQNAVIAIPANKIKIIYEDFINQGIIEKSSSNPP